jgi:hypothetical protein
MEAVEAVSGVDDHGNAPFTMDRLDLHLTPLQPSASGTLMDTVERLIYASWIFRIVITLLGLVVIGIGLYLFRQANQARSAGSLSAEYGEGKLNLRGAAIATRVSRTVGNWPMRLGRLMARTPRFRGGCRLR